MKTIGLIGGMSWESTVSYYQLINEAVKKELGGLHSAKIILNSVNFAEIAALQESGDWDQTAKILSKAARSLESAGADCILICANTMHIVASQVRKATGLPLIHIAEATGQILKDKDIKRVGLLGTRFTMEQSFYRDILEQQHGIQVIVPKKESRDKVHDIIYQELCLGHILTRSRQIYQSVIEELHQAGAQAVILGCTEIAMLIQQKHTSMPLFNTTEIHAQAAVKFALAR